MSEPNASAAEQDWVTRLADEVTTDSGYVVEPLDQHRFTVAAIDLGIKTNTPRNFTRRGVRSVEEIAVTAGMPATEVLGPLTMLNVRGLAIGAGHNVALGARHIDRGRWRRA